MPRFRLVCLPIIYLALAACQAPEPVSEPAPEPAPPSGVSASPSPGMVAAAHPLAVEAGLDILRAGGSAVDAAVAVQAALGLVEPQSSGLGGGGFLLVHDPASGETTVYDGRETAPASADETLFLDADGEPLRYFDGIVSGRSTGVPGAVAALAAAHADHGKLPWAETLAPVLPLAEDGFTVTARMSSMLERMQGFGSPLDADPLAGPLWYPEGAPVAAGTSLVNSAYGESLRALQANPRALLEGPLAEAIVARVGEPPRPGGLTLADLAAYEVVERAPVCTSYRGLSVCSAPPPASGGVFLAQALGILETVDMGALGPTPAGWHRFIEASRLAYADRDAYVGAPEAMERSLAELTDADYLARRAAEIDPDRAIPAAAPGLGPCPDRTPDREGTSHFAVVDADGLALAMTTTVEGPFGSQRMVGGFVLNNQLTDFGFRPVVDGCAHPNRPGPGKRPRSSMSPTLVFDADGGFLFSTGSPGGNSIPAYTLKTLVGMIDWGLSPQDAADLPNVVARGDTVRVEKDAMDPATLEALRALGHEIDDGRGEISGIHIIARDPDGTLTGAADARREGVVRSAAAE